MKLLYHNMLFCNNRENGCSEENSFPLRIEAAHVEEVVTHPDDINREFLLRMLDKLNWTVVVSASREIGIQTLPDTLPDVLDDEFISQLQKILIDTEVVTGSLTCPNCGRKYPVTKSIVNMMIAHEGEDGKE